jgi:hypothetical protein
VRKVSAPLRIDFLEEAMTCIPEDDPPTAADVRLWRHVYADRLARYLDELANESGTLTPSEIEAVRREWLDVVQINEGRTPADGDTPRKTRYP